MCYMTAANSAQVGSRQKCGLKSQHRFPFPGLQQRRHTSSLKKQKWPVVLTLPLSPCLLPEGLVLPGLTYPHVIYTRKGFQEC